MNYLLLLFMLILIGEFLFDKWLDRLNLKNWSEELPESAKGIYDADRYKLSQQYYRTNLKFGNVTSAFSLILMLSVLLFHGFAWLDNEVRQTTDSAVWQALIFFGVLGLASDILGLPFSIYKTFVIEEKFGFNKTTVKTFITDKLKGYLLAALVGGGLLALIVKLYSETGELFWVLAWIVVSTFTIFVSMFYTAVLLPIFNKLTPLEEGPLKEAIQSYSAKVGFALKHIYVMDGSKRSSKANAFFSGLGHRKTIVLYDTLVNNYSVEELAAVLAHEVGHYKKKHTLKGMAMAVANSGLVFFILSLFLGNGELAKAFGASQSSFHLDVLAFGILYSPLSELIGIGMNYLSRKHEFEADAFAKETYNGVALGSALKKLTADNLSNLTPHKTVVFVHYSHPPVLQRLDALQA